MKHTGKKELLELTHQKDAEGVKSFLESLHQNVKGVAFEWYLAELYKGNGWLTEIGSLHKKVHKISLKNCKACKMGSPIKGSV